MKNWLSLFACRAATVRTDISGSISRPLDEQEYCDMVSKTLRALVLNYLTPGLRRRCGPVYIFSPISRQMLASEGDACGGFNINVGCDAMPCETFLW